MESRVETETAFTDKVVSRSYLAANMVVAAATGVLMATV